MRGRVVQNSAGEMGNGQTTKGLVGLYTLTWKAIKDLGRSVKCFDLHFDRQRESTPRIFLQ